MTINHLVNFVNIPISFSYVCVWKKPIAIYPDFITDKEFSKSFFDNGNNTVGTATDGFTIINQNRPNDSLTIGNIKFVISASSKDDLYKYYERFLSKLDEEPEYKGLTSTIAYGINILFELEFENDVLPLIADKFLKPNIDIQLENIEYKVLLDDNEYCRVNMMTKSDSLKTLLIATNHHHANNGSILSLDEIIDSVENSLKIINDIVINKLSN